MKFHILGIVLGVIVGLPAVALGSSFTYSLIQGQSPSQAVSAVGRQINSLFGKVDDTEAEQQVINDRLDVLEKENPVNKPALNENRYVPEPESELRQFALDAETQAICDEAAAFEGVNKKSIKGDIQSLCIRLTGKYETREQFDEVVESLHDKWELWIKTRGD